MAASMALRSRSAIFSSRTCAPPARAVRLAVRAQAVKPDVQTPKQLTSVLAPATMAVVANAMMALPALAESGKLFDFNLTLPAMVGEFLLLMVFLEKTWFTPVGKILDERDAQIREKLGAVKDDSSGVDALLAEAESVLKKARAEVSQSVMKAKADKQAELDKAYNAAKEAVNKETETAMAALNKESDAMLAKLDAQVDKIGAEVLSRVLPAGVKMA